MDCRFITISLGIALVSLSWAPSVHADQPNEDTIIKFSAPVELPGVVLPAGTYEFRLVANKVADGDIVMVYGEDGHLCKLFLTEPDVRPQPTRNTVIKFAKTPAGAPLALKEWFYPGKTRGHEFIYPDSYGLKSTDVSVGALN